MSRSGYSEDADDVLMYGRWQAQVNSAIRGKRGQRFLRDLVTALDAMPVKELVAGELSTAEGEVCALGALGRHRGVDLDKIDTYDYETLGYTFDIADQLSRETMYVNDEGCSTENDDRWKEVRAWAARNIKLTIEELPEVNQ